MQQNTKKFMDNKSIRTRSSKPQSNGYSVGYEKRDALFRQKPKSRMFMKSSMLSNN